MLTHRDKHLMIEAYRSGRSATKIGQDFNIDTRTVTYHLAKAGVAMRSQAQANRKYALNEAAFDSDSPDAHYFAGLLLTDGCVTMQNGGKNPCLCLEVAERDIAVVDSLRTFLGSTHPIKRRMTSKGKFPAVRLRISSEKLAVSVARFGIVPNKTKRVAAVGLEMDRDFWRGAIDGDGSVALSRTGPHIRLVGTKELVTQFLAFVNSITTCRAQPRQYPGVWEVHLTGGVMAQKVIRVLYENCKTALPRKLAVAEKVMRWQSQSDRLAQITLDSLNALHAAHGSWRKVAIAMNRSLIGVMLLLRQRRNQARQK